MLNNINKTVKLKNGIKMPMLGLGTWLASNGQEVENAIRIALDVGYRSIDTAAIYGNEKSVGKAIRESDIPREQIFVTSKLWNSDQGFNSTLKAFNNSIRKLNINYLDLYLIHWPVRNKYKESWKALEKLYSEKKVRAIGVSNFHIHHLNDLLKEADIIPTVNQVEFHPYLTQTELKQYCSKYSIQFEAWSPLMQGNFMSVPTIHNLSEKYGKTPAQIILRWDIQHNVVTIPKTIHEDRIKENVNIYDFELTVEDMKKIDSLNKDHRFGPDPDSFNF